MADEVVEVGVAAAARDLEDQINANASGPMTDMHILSNKALGTSRPTQALKFNCLFLEEPLFTSGYQLIKRSEETSKLVMADTAGVLPAVIGGIGMFDFTPFDELSPVAVDTRVVFRRDPRYPDPIVSAGLLDWVRDSKGRYTGALYTLTVQYPEVFTIQAMGQGKGKQEYPDQASLSRPDLRAPRTTGTGLLAADGTDGRSDVARSAAAPAPTETFPWGQNYTSDELYLRREVTVGEVRHWLKFEAEGMYDLGPDVATTIGSANGGLPSVTPGTGESTGKNKYAPLDVLQGAVAEHSAVVQSLQSAGATDSPEYGQALINLRTANAMLTNAQNNA